MKILVVEQELETENNHFVRDVVCIPRENDLFNVFGTVVANVDRVILSPNAHLVEMVMNARKDTVSDLSYLYPDYSRYELGIDAVVFLGEQIPLTRENVR